MKSGKQIKDLINNIARKKNINAQVLLRNYMLERLLERIALSKYNHNFILKGGMLIASMIGVDQRSTVDLDATIKSLPLKKFELEKMLNEILKIDVNDGIELKLIKLEEIRDEAEYRGLRGSLEAKLDGMKIPLKIDLTTGDEITPKEINYQYELILEDRKINIMAYNIETVLAEKIETVISRGIANTRVRDFYDIYALTESFKHTINWSVLSKALAATSKIRQSSNLLMEGHKIVKEITSDSGMANHWKRYQSQYAYAKGITWSEISKSVERACERIDVIK